MRSTTAHITASNLIERPSWRTHQLAALVARVHALVIGIVPIALDPSRLNRRAHVDQCSSNSGFAPDSMIDTRSCLYPGAILPSLSFDRQPCITRHVIAVLAEHGLRRDTVSCGSCSRRALVVAVRVGGPSCSVNSRALGGLPELLEQSSRPALPQLGLELGRPPSSVIRFRQNSVSPNRAP